MEIVCRTGDDRLDKMAEVLIRNATAGYSPPDGVRFVLSEREEDAAAEDFLILLYRAQTAPSASSPRRRVLRRPYRICELERTARLLLSAESAPPNPFADPTRPSVVWDGRTVSCGSVAVPLTGREAAVFAVLYENRGTPVSRERLTEEAWGKPATRTNLCDVYVCRLRGKLEPIFGKGFLVAIRNEGYRMT